MIITWFGRGCFRLEGAGRVVVTDPPPGEEGREIARGAHIVTVSDGTPSDLAGPFVIIGPGEYEVQRTFIKGVATPAVEGAESNTAYCITFDELTVCHLGAPGVGLTEAHRDAIGAVDVLLAPVTGPPGVTPEAAVDVVNELEPSFVVPIHGVDTGHLAQFLREMGADDAVAASMLEVSALRLPDEAQVRVLELRSGGR